MSNIIGYECRDCNSYITTSDGLKLGNFVDEDGFVGLCPLCGSSKVFPVLKQLPTEMVESDE